jgi:hypothetical protein
MKSSEFADHPDKVVAKGVHQHGFQCVAMLTTKT